MKAINKITGALIQVRTTKERFFSGKVLKDPSGIWKKGEYGSRFDIEKHILLPDSLFNLLVEHVKRLQDET